MGFLVKWRQRLGSWAQGVQGAVCMFLVAFFESTVLLFPVDLLLIALVPLSRFAWHFLALLSTVGSVLGGWLGYGLAQWAWASWAVPILQKVAGESWVLHEGRYDLALPSYITTPLGEWLGGDHLFEIYDLHSTWVVLLFALSPLPYKLVALTAGAAQTNLAVFLLASVLGRGTRFYFLAYITHYYGERALALLQKWILTLTVLLVLGIVASVVALMWL